MKKNVKKIASVTALSLLLLISGTFFFASIAYLLNGTPENYPTQAQLLSIRISYGIMLVISLMFVVYSVVALIKTIKKAKNDNNADNTDTKSGQPGCLIYITKYVVLPIIVYLTVFLTAIYIYKNVSNWQLVWNIGTFLLVSIPFTIILAVIILIINKFLFKKDKLKKTIILFTVLYIAMSLGFFSGLAALQ